MNTIYISDGARTAITGVRHKAPKPGTVEQSLLKRILKGYDTDARGVVDPNDSVSVNVSFLLLRIQGLVRELNQFFLGMKACLIFMA